MVATLDPQTGQLQMREEKRKFCEKSPLAVTLVTCAAVAMEMRLKLPRKK